MHLKNKIIVIITFIMLLPIINATKASGADILNYTYTIINNEATIIGFTGEPIYIEIPESIEGYPVTQIRDNAFFNCTSLKQISLPSCIKKIGHHTFYGCISLESVVLPTSLNEIGMGAFRGCISLSAVNIPATLNTLPESCFRSCSALTEIVIPIGIRSIEKFCFYDCSALSYVSLSNELSEIGEQAFYMCTSLEGIYIPPSVKIISHESIGFERGEAISEIKNDFTILGESGTNAEKYAKLNNMNFSVSSEAVQVNSISTSGVRKVPLWVLLILSCGGIGFFALSCIIAIKQHLHEKNK